MHEFNQALFMKINWGMVHDRESLCARIIRHKCGCCTDLLPLVKAMQFASLIWRYICQTWELFVDGLRWEVGDGQRVQFWHDRWLPSGTILSQVVVDYVPPSLLNAIVADFVHLDGRWKVERFVGLIPDVFFQEVCCSIPPSQDMGPDKLMWGLTASGIYSMNSTYELAMDNFFLAQPDPIWRLINVLVLCSRRLSMMG